MKLSSTDPGLVVSGLGHVALLIAMLVGFSDAKKFEDAQESIPIEMVTNQQFAQIMKGEKTEKEIRAKPTRVDKVADVAETHRAPPVAEAKTDVPTPPPPLRHIADPGTDDQPQPQPHQQQAAQPPPPPPRPADLPKAEAKPDPPLQREAEALAPPQPAQRPREEPKKVAFTPPLPPVRPTLLEPPRPKPQDKLEPDEVAKIIDADKADKASARPKSGEESNDRHPRLDLADISRLLSKDTPQQRASTGRELSRVASLGSPTASAPKMSPSLWGQLDGLMQEQYKQCWSYLGLDSGEEYIPEIAVQFTSTGALATQPKLRNPPRDPSMRSLAESALRAVERCNPLRIPPQYAPYYDEWKSRILRFDPEEMSG